MEKKIQWKRSISSSLQTLQIMSELPTHSMLIHPTQAKQALMYFTDLRSSRSQEAWRHITWRLGKPVASYMLPNSILLKKKKKRRPATSTQTGQEQFEQMSSEPLASETWDTLLKPEAKQDLGVVHSKGKRGEEGHFETVTRSRDAEFDAWSLCDKTSSGFANEVAQGELSLPEPAPSFYVPWCKRTTL